MLTDDLMKKKSSLSKLDNSIANVNNKLVQACTCLNKKKHA